MPETVTGIRPQLLRWARESRGLSVDDVTSRLRLKTGDVNDWEGGQKTPTRAQLRKLARLYRRSTAVFYLPEPPPDPPELPDFRRPSRSRSVLSPELRLELRRAIYRRRVSLEILGRAERSRVPEADPHAEPDQTARLLRQALGVSLADQIEASDQYAALALWIDAIEALGVLVFQASHVSVEEARGFSLANDRLPVIVLNGADSARARSFTLAHEIAHLAFRSGGLCDLEGGTDRDRLIEPLCNRVAGALLIPTDDFAVLMHADISVDSIAELANRYWVSSEVVLLRLLHVGRIAQGDYRFLLAEIRATYPEKKGQGGNYYRTLTRNNGYRYSALILDALAREVITPLEGARYLGAKIEHLERVAGLLERRDLVQHARV